MWHNLAAHLLEQTGVKIGDRDTNAFQGARVGPLLAMEIALGIVPLWREAAVPAPSSSPAPLDCSSTADKNLAAISPASNRSRFLVKTVTSQIGCVHRQAGKPLDQHVVTHLLHPRGFGTDRMKSLQKQCTQQLLGRDRGPPAADGLPEPAPRNSPMKAPLRSGGPLRASQNITINRMALNHACRGGEVSFFATC